MLRAILSSNELNRNEKIKLIIREATFQFLEFFLVTNQTSKKYQRSGHKKVELQGAMANSRAPLSST